MPPVLWDPGILKEETQPPCLQDWRTFQVAVHPHLSSLSQPALCLASVWCLFLWASASLLPLCPSLPSQLGCKCTPTRKSSKPFFTAFSQHCYIWFLQPNFVHTRQGEEEIPKGIFF